MTDDAPQLPAQRTTRNATPPSGTGQESPDHPHLAATPLRTLSIETQKPVRPSRKPASRSDAAPGTDAGAPPGASQPGATDPPVHRRPGRPLKIESPQEFERLAAEYVTECHKAQQPALFTGLALYLGFTDRHALIEYGERPAFAHVVKRARALIEAEYEQKLERDRPTGAIFALKQVGWADTQRLDVRGVMATVDFSRLSDDGLARVRAGEDALTVARTDRGVLPAGVPHPVALPARVETIENAVIEEEAPAEGKK